jgi:hypothetical protein
MSTTEMVAYRIWKTKNGRKIYLTLVAGYGITQDAAEIVN